MVIQCSPKTLVELTNNLGKNPHNQYYASLFSEVDPKQDNKLLYYVNPKGFTEQIPSGMTISKISNSSYLGGQYSISFKINDKNKKNIELIYKIYSSYVQNATMGAYSDQLTYSFSF